MVQSADTKAKTPHHYGKTNILYTAASVENLKAAFVRSRTLSLTMDEVSALDTSVLQIFAACPATPDVAHGWCCPPQLLPELSIDLQQKKIALRIATAADAATSRKKPKPEGDELIATWHCCLGMENAVKNLLPDSGLDEFKPQPPWPAPARLTRTGTYAQGRDGRWRRRLGDDNWENVIHGAQRVILIWGVMGALLI